jgi:hypothetical protein
MTQRKKLYGLLGVLLGAILTTEAGAQWVNGWYVYPYKNFTNSSVCRRPRSATDKGLALSDWRISKLPINNKGMNLTTTKNPDGSVWAYRWIAVWHCEISDVWRTPGYHTDFIRIAGSGNYQDVPTTVLIQDVYFHDGEGIPLLIQDGVFDKITLKDLRVKNTTVCLQICTINSGKVGVVEIDHCPNMSIAIMGRPGSIGTVYVKNSPGLKIADTETKNGFSGAKIIRLN